MADRIRFDAEHPPGRDVDDVLVPLVLDALGCTDPALARTPRTSLEPDPIDRSPRASSAEVEVTTTWRTESPAGHVRVDRTYSFFPGDVNEPVRAWERVTVHAALAGRPAVTVHALVGERTMPIEVEPTPEGERIVERILEGLQATYGWW